MNNFIVRIEVFFYINIHIIINYISIILLLFNLLIFLYVSVDLSLLNDNYQLNVGEGSDGSGGSDGPGASHGSGGLGGSGNGGASGGANNTNQSSVATVSGGGLSRENESTNTLTSFIDMYSNTEDTTNKEDTYGNIPIKLVVTPSDNQPTSDQAIQGPSKPTNNATSSAQSSGNPASRIPRDSSNSSLLSNASSTPSINTLDKAYKDAQESGHIGST